MIDLPQIVKGSTPWNKGKLIGQKPPLKLREIWAIRIRLQLKKETRELAIFNLAIDSKLRSCDAAENTTARSIRNHRTNQRRTKKLDKPQSFTS